MKRSKIFSKIVDLASVCATLLLVSSSLIAQVSPRTPAPNRNVTPLGQQKPQPPGRQMGTIMGYVYWDASALQYNHSSPCQGLSVSVGVGTPPSGSTPTFEQFKTFGNATSSFTALSNVGTFALCAYTLSNVPLSPADLQVQIHVQQSAFAPAVNPAIWPTANDPNSPIRIPGGTCNKLAPAIPSASVLGSGWWTCGAYAYNVNFILQPVRSAQLMSATGSARGMQPASGGAQVARSPSPGGAPLLRNPGPAGTPLLKNPGPPGEPSRKNPGPGGRQAQASSGTLLGNGGPGTSGITDGTRQTYTGTTRGATAQTLTNADVISMLKAGLAESVIVAFLEGDPDAPLVIQSARKNFDFSPAGCQALQRARVSAAILASMGDGSVRPCPAITGNAPATTPGGQMELNPQPLPPGSKAPQANRTALKPIKLAPPKALRRVANPLLAQQNASIIAVLEQQTQAAQQEASMMKPGIRSVASAVPARAPAAGATFQGSAGVQNIGPETTQSEHGNLASSISHASPFNSLVVTCLRDPTPRIIQVSGGQVHGIFTPEAKYNLYTIVGCSFGQSDPGNSAYIFGVNGFKANLNIDFWSDSGVTVHLDPWLAGVLDQDNVTLVVAPAGKQPFSKSGYKFYAARGMPAPDGSDQEIALAYNSMPESKVALVNATNFPAGFDQIAPSATSVFPSFSFQGTPVAGWVFRYLYGHADRIAVFRGADCYINDIGLNGAACQQPDLDKLVKTDVWNFNRLTPGFAISSYNLYYADIDPASLCGVWTDLPDDHSGSTNGIWDFNLNQSNQIDVAWRVYVCHDSEFGTRDNFADQSAYGLAVWVMGPRCVNPWTGQKDQACMAKVHQIFGS